MLPLLSQLSILFSSAALSFSLHSQSWINPFINKYQPQIHSTHSSTQSLCPKITHTVLLCLVRHEAQSLVSNSFLPLTPLLISLSISSFFLPCLVLSSSHQSSPLMKTGTFFSYISLLLILTWCLVSAALDYVIKPFKLKILYNWFPPWRIFSKYYYLFHRCPTLGEEVTDLFPGRNPSQPPWL